MALAISNESKNNLSITNENKPGASDTWATHTETWADAGGNWSAPGLPITKDLKNNLTITNENKN